MRSWQDIIGDTDVDGYQNNVADVSGSGEKRQKRNIHKKKKIAIKLVTRGGTKIKEKGGGISTSGVKGLMGNFHIGDAKLGATYDMYNLVRKDKAGAGSCRRDAKSRKEKFTGECSLIWSEAIDGIEIDEPPDTNPAINIKQNFHFGKYNNNEELVKEKQGKGMEDALVENEDKEVVCETL